MKNEYLTAFTPSWTGELNMGVDSFLGETLLPALPLVRFYTWDCPTISYGCHQKPDKRINLALCRDEKIPVVARPTGGRELLHGHDLCYSVIWPSHERITAIDAKKVFADINDALITGLKQLGLEAEWNEFRNKPRALDGPCFAQIDSGEISIQGKKLIASAQRIFAHCIVQQGSIPLRKPSVDLLRYLQHPDRESIRMKINQVSTDFLEQTGSEMSLAFIVQCFRVGFDKMFGSQAQNGDELFTDYQRNNKN